MLKRLLRRLDTSPPNCRWFKKIGGQRYCYNGENSDEIRKCFDEHEADSRLLWEINEVSDRELAELISEIDDARDEFESFLRSSKTDY